MRKNEPQKKNVKPTGFFPTQRDDAEILAGLFPPPQESPDAPTESNEAPAESAKAPEDGVNEASENPTSLAEEAKPSESIAEPEETISLPDAPVSEEIAAVSEKPVIPEQPEEPAPSRATEPGEKADAPAPEAREEDSTREYGAPQPLYEDIIPAGFSIEDKKREKEKEKARLAAIRKAEAEEKRRQKEWEEEQKRREKEEALEAKKKAKTDKKKAKTAALIAAVEGKAVADAEKEIKRETGEDYKFESTDTQTKSPKTEKTEKEKPELEEIIQADDLLPPKKEYSRFELKLRRKYKMDRDMLLSENTVVPGFVIAKNENLIRTYYCLSGKGGGTICLTNKRLLINAGERSEVALDQISGIKFSNFTHLNPFKFLFGLLFFALGALLLILAISKNAISIPYITGSHYKSWFPYLFFPCGGVSLLIGLPMLFTSVKRTFYFCVYARTDAPFLEYKSAALAKREKKGKVFKYAIAKPGKESDKAARELGALILEVKEGRYDN